MGITAYGYLATPSLSVFDTAMAEFMEHQEWSRAALCVRKQGSIRVNRTYVRTTAGDIAGYTAVTERDGGSTKTYYERIPPSLPETKLSFRLASISKWVLRCLCTELMSKAGGITNATLVKDLLVAGGSKAGHPHFMLANINEVYAANRARFQTWTIGDLINHATGAGDEPDPTWPPKTADQEWGLNIPSVALDTGWEGYPGGQPTRRDVHRYLLMRRRAYDPPGGPGSYFYSNFNYSLLGICLEQFYKVGLAELLEAYVFRTASLKNTYVARTLSTLRSPSEPQYIDHSGLYNNSFDPRLGPNELRARQAFGNNFTQECLLGADGVVTTAEDLTTLMAKYAPDGSRIPLIPVVRYGVQLGGSLPGTFATARWLKDPDDVQKTYAVLFNNRFVRTVGVPPWKTDGIWEGIPKDTGADFAGLDRIIIGLGGGL